MSKKPTKKSAKKVIVKPPHVQPRQPKLKQRKAPKSRPNGPMVETPAALELGPRMLPAADLALEVFEEVAAMNDRALELEAIYRAKAAEAKDAKDAWKAKVEELQRHVRLNSHESSLPLLQSIEDVGTREADQQAMEAATHFDALDRREL